MENLAPPLVELIIRAEAALEKRLLALAVIYPKTIIETSNGFEPEIDLTVCRFWRKFKDQKEEILGADTETAQAIALGCTERGEWLIYTDSYLKDNAFLALGTIIPDLTAIRTVRKAIRWVEERGLLTEAVYHG